jgi:flagellar protein FlaI
VMASALDFIVVQHRIHDRRKGTVRRMTEIAEVIKEGEKPVVKTIFVWEPKEDTMLQVQSDINYLRLLKEYTALELSDLEDEIQRRSEFLKGLMNRRVKGMDALKREIQGYFEEGKKRWQKS